MFELKEKRGITGNLAYAVLAQLSMFVSSALMSLLVPKVLGVEQYGYWQLFILYAGYSGMLLFGMNDGIYLRLGGKHVEELDYPTLKSEYIVSIAGETCLLAACLTVVIPFTSAGSRLAVLFLTAIYALVFCSSTSISYVFQATNLVHIYSTSILVSRLVYVATLVMLIVAQVHDFKVYAIFYIAAQVVALAYCLMCARPILRTRAASIARGLAMARIDIASGLKVMIAYYAGALIIGFGRMLVDARWGIEAFGVYSFSTSLVSFALSFVGQVSLVLFPAVKRMSGEASRQSYLKIRRALCYFLPLAYLVYYPACWLIDLWLPQYAESSKYLALLLPICFFDCKMSMLYNTYLKALRCEKIMLRINLIAMGVSAILSWTAAFCFGSKELVAVSMVIGVAVRSIVAELYLGSLLEVRSVVMPITEVLLGGAFMYVAFVLRSAFGVTVIVVLFYFIQAVAFAWGRGTHQVRSGSSEDQ